MAEADDRNAVLEWNGGTAGAQQPANVAGYLVSWWPADNSAQLNTRITAYQRLQLQPLDNGRTYKATVASIGHDGSVSSPSAELSVVPGSTRVDQMRTRMSAFFDDFNLPSGLPDELKWDTAFAGCNNPDNSGFFINAQFHAHNNLGSRGGPCGISQTSARPRMLLDLSDKGTRTITFDFDGDFGRDNMYLQFVPRQPWSAYQGAQWRQAKSLKQFSANDVAGELNLHVNEQNIGLEFINTDGSVNYVQDAHPGDQGMAMLPNVRRHWEVRLSSSNVEVLLDGTSMIKTALALAPTQYAMLWNLFSYNGAKNDIPLALHHWDNFGFTAPAGAAAQPVVHNYRLNNGGTDKVSSQRASNTVGTVQLNIPDSLAGATERRLGFTLNGYSARWDAKDKVTINGRAFAMPKPYSATSPQIGWDDLVGNINPYSFEMVIPDGVLKTGLNTIAFETEQDDILNIHVEVDFAPGTQPAYTPPSAIAQGTGMPTAYPIGPNILTTSVNGLQTWYQESSDTSAPQNTNLKASGTVDVVAEASNLSTVYATGSAIGIVEVGLLVDGQLSVRRNVAKTTAPPTSTQTFRWDTTTLADGFHELYAYACNKDGTAAMKGEGEMGGYAPLVVSVTNHGGSSQVYKATTKPDIVGLCQGTARATALRALGGPATDRDLCVAPATSATAAALSRK